MTQYDIFEYLFSRDYRNIERMLKPPQFDDVEEIMLKERDSIKKGEITEFVRPEND